MQQLQEIYINFTISSFEKIEMIKLSKLTGSSHDVFTKHLLLNNPLDDDESTYLYLVTNDIDLSFDKVLEIYKS